MTLQTIGPQDAVDLYLEYRQPEVSKKTLQNQRYRLNAFIEWCEEQGIENLNGITGRDLHRFRIWRQQDVTLVTLRGQLATLRTFLEFLASIDGCEDGLREKVKLPTVDRGEEARDELLTEDRAEELLAYLETYQKAGRTHVIILLLWHTGMRLGSLRAIDLEDFRPDERCFWIQHRPESGTPLKNQHAAERPVALDAQAVEILEAYIEYHRRDVIDRHGRNPLLTSSQGRLSPGQIRDDVYRITQPCQIGPCPHDRDPDDCEATDHGHYSKCPSNVSPHQIRRGAITRQLRNGVSEAVVSGRSNVSREVMDQHYDRRTPEERMEQRRAELEEKDR